MLVVYVVRCMVLLYFVTFGIFSVCFAKCPDLASSCEPVDSGMGLHTDMIPW